MSSLILNKKRSLNIVSYIVTQPNQVDSLKLIFMFRLLVSIYQVTVSNS